MDFLANPNEISFRFGEYIEEFQTILAANDIKYGAPDNFTTFARRLSSDELLAADLDRMVRSVILRETGNVSLRTILTIIAIATGSKAIAEPNRDFSNSMQIVIDAMIRSGGCSPGDPKHLDTFCRSTTPSSAPDPLLHLNDTPADLNQSLTRLQLNATEAMHYLDSIEQRIIRMEPFFEALPSTKTSPATPTAVPISNRIRILLDHSISCFTILLNDSAVRLTQFLATHKSSFRNKVPTFVSDKFTHKFSNIQKQFDTTLTTFTDKFFGYSFTDKLRSYPSTQKLVSHPFTQKLLSFSFTSFTDKLTDKLFDYRFAVTNKLVNHPYTDKLLSHPYTQKLLSYKVSNQFIQRTAAAPLSVAAIVGGTLLYLTIEHKPNAVILSSTAPITGTAAVTPTISAADHPQLTVYADQPGKPSAKPHKPSAYTVQTATTAFASHPQRPTEPGPAPSATAALTQPTPALRASTEDGTPTSTEENSTHSGKYALTSLTSWSRPSPSHAVDVSSGIMASNLVSATPPTYPKLASLFHMQGKVVMQAVIAKNGTVQSLQVLQGHHLLRGAAKNAVTSWRYRPYLIDDKPVDVATIVTVDFNLPHQDLSRSQRSPTQPPNGARSGMVPSSTP